MPVAADKIVKEFRSHFGTEAQPAIYRAPGRVNLIGEHTDYNLGFVFPIALKMACYVAIAPGNGKVRVYSQQFQDQFEIRADEIATAKRSGKWSDYVLGVANLLANSGTQIRGADLYMTTEVPLGSGLSSSAAVEIASAFAFLGNTKMEPLDIARLGQRAESQFVGMPCGIMDQYASVFGHEQAAIQIDCRDLKHAYVQLPRDVKIIAVNSLVKHELGTSAYRDRVAECGAAVEAIQKIDPKVQSLRDVSLEFFQQIENSIPELPRKRARHVISDSRRVLDLATAARSHNLHEMGRLFIASHRSMQFDYEISCEEIDFLVDTAIKIPGVYGARMTGGGFGGCTVNLVAPDAASRFEEQLSSAYKERYGITPGFYDCEPGQGAGKIE